MHVVILFATVEGQTRKIARHMAGTVQSLGHDVTVYDAADLEDVDLDLADAFIAAAPVHIGRFPAPFVHWVKERADALNGKRSAFVSVSLGIASQFEAEKREIDAIGEAFFAETGWHPGAVHHAAGALRYTRYDFLKRLLMRHIAAKEGGDVDTSEDHEYTDWDGLAAFVTGFLAADG